MRVITQEDINCDIRERASFQKNTRELSEVVLDKYGLNSHYSLDAKIAIMNQLPSIYFSLDKQLTGKRILDLGCGSKNPTIEFNVANPRKYEPWLCRALLETSAKPIGIDVGYLGDEEFEHYEGNLLLPSTFFHISDQSVDLVNLSGVFGSRYSHGNIDQESLKANIFSQAKRVLKPNGIFLYNDH